LRSFRHEGNHFGGLLTNEAEAATDEDVLELFLDFAFVAGTPRLESRAPLRCRREELELVCMCFVPIQRLCDAAEPSKKRL
jgi:hypothetical protein